MAAPNPCRSQTGDAASYRRPMPVTELIVFCSGSGYYRCPRCGCTMEREFMAYCDRCGQCLNWRQHKKAHCTYCSKTLAQK